MLKGLVTMMGRKEDRLQKEASEIKSSKAVMRGSDGTRRKELLEEDSNKASFKQTNPNA